MQQTITKIAFYDPETEKFYSGERGIEMLFTDDISKAKLYTGGAYDFNDIFNYVQIHSKKMLNCIDVDINYFPRIGSSQMADSKINERRNKLQAEFDILDAEASIDIESMAEPRWRRWKKLKRDLSNTI